MQLTPGFVFIAQNLPRFLVAPSLVYLCSYIAEDYFGYTLPTGAVVCISIISAPTSLILGNIWDYYRNIRDASARGAVMPTLLPAKWPGGLDLAAQVKKAVETRFPGA